ncbi:MAG TPA: hypothetical protein VD866_28585 [Urbifossiella sp.]|nr:hypothetical protein [Urbifossiella sp.]
METPAGPDAIAALFRDRDNLLAAQQWAIAAGDPTLSARILIGAARAVAARAPWQLRRDRLLDAIQALGDRDPARRARLRVELADTWWGVGAYDLAREPAEQAVAEARRLGDDTLLADALHQRGTLAEHLGERVRAADDFAEGVRRASGAGLAGAHGRNLIGLATCHDWGGRYGPARSAGEEAVRLLTRAGNELALARAVNGLGLILWRNGDPDAAARRFAEAESLERRFGNLRLVAGRLTNRGLALTDLDRLDEALALFAEADGIHADQGNRGWRAVNAAGWGIAELLAGRPADAAARLAAALDEAVATRYAENEALIAGGLARALLALGRAGEAELYVRQALEFQLGKDGGRHRRYWGNLVVAARIARALGRSPAEVGPVIGQATRLGIELKVRADDPVRLAREDERHRAELVAWVGGG